ncbi:MAG TPA: hypothetical protein HA224_02605 [Nanoarchaeota archaeon]|nr:hypothetical protein [Nanoarchaeota archaeon]
MAAKLNSNLAVVLIAVAIVAGSFVTSQTGFAVSDKVPIDNPVNFCTDGDGQDVSVKDTCIDASGEKKTDRCFSASSVQETYCSPFNKCNYQIVNCAYGEECVGGTCRQAN